MEGVIIKIKKMFIIACIFSILILAAGMSFASADVDDMQANDNMTEVSDVNSAFLGRAGDDNLMTVDESEPETLVSDSDYSLRVLESYDESGEAILDSSSDNEVLKANGQIIYINNYSTPVGDGSTQDTPTTWNNAFESISSGGTIIFLPGNYTNIKNVNLNKENITLKGSGDGVNLIGQSGRFFQVSKQDIVIDSFSAFSISNIVCFIIIM